MPSAFNLNSNYHVTKSKPTEVYFCNNVTPAIFNPGDETDLSQIPDVEYQIDEILVIVPSQYNSPSFYVPSPLADIFTPLKNIIFENCAIAAVLATVLIISSFLINEININSKHLLYDLSPRDILKQLKIQNTNKIIIGHLNINSIWNKFECLSYIIEKNLDIFLISETKLNDTFPESQFLLHGFHPPYRKDRTDKGGGLLLYVHEYIPCREIIVEFLPIIEAIVIEINLKKEEVAPFMFI